MPSPARTVSERMAAQHTKTNQETFNAVLALLQQKRAADETQGELIAAARNLAKALTVYSEAVKADLPDVKLDRDEQVRFCEDEAVKQRNLARELLASLNHPACKYSTLPPEEEHTLSALLQKLTAGASDIDAARKLRAELRPQPPAMKRNRWMLCRSIDHAWFVATGQPHVPGRKQSLDQVPCGEFHDFITAILSITKETRHIAPDELHREIIALTHNSAI